MRIIEFFQKIDKRIYAGVIGSLLVIITSFLISTELIPAYLLVVGIISIPFVVVTIKNPFLGLVVFVAILPIDDVLSGVFGGFGTFSRLLGILVFGAWIIKALLVDHKKIRFLPSAVVLIIFVLWGLLSPLWAERSDIALSSALRLIQLVLLFIAVTNLTVTSKQVITLIIALSLGISVIAIMGLLNINTNIETGLLTLEGLTTALFGLYLGLLLQTAILYLVGGFERFRILALLAILLVIYPVFLNSERAVILATVSSLLLTSLIFIRKQKRLLFGLVVSILVLGISLYGLINLKLIPSFIISRYSVADVATTSVRRLEIWRIGLMSFKSSPLFGYGMDNFSVIIGRFIASSNTAQRIAIQVDPHNTLLQIAVDLGAVGLILFLLALALVIFPYFKLAAQKLDRQKMFLMSLCACLFFFTFIDGFFVTFLYIKVFWLLLALLAVLPSIIMQTDTAEGKQ